jgi:hypothetical protein
MAVTVAPVVRKYSTLPENRGDLHSFWIERRRRAGYGKLLHAETIVLAQRVANGQRRAG